MKRKKENVLVVGGTGFIGYNFIKKIIKKKKFKIFSISTTFPSNHNRVKNVKYIICDISDKKKLKNKLDKIDFKFVINLGGYVDHSDKKKILNSHYLGCKNLAEVFLNKKVKKFIQIGSSVEYGHLKSPHKENYKINLTSLKSNYGIAKLKSTLFLQKLYKKLKFPVVILRLYICYGPNQSINRFIPIIIKNCLQDVSFPCSHGKQFRDFIFIDDLVDIIYKCFYKTKIEGEIFNIGTGKPRKIKKIIETIKKLTKGGKPNYGKVKLRKDELKIFYPSIKKIKKYFNWQAKTPFLKGLSNTINFYEKQL